MDSTKRILAQESIILY